MINIYEQIEDPDGELLDPSDITVASDGSVYLSVRRKGQVVRYGPDMTQPELVLNVEGEVQGMCCHGDGTLWALSRETSPQSGVDHRMLLYRRREGEETELVFASDWNDPSLSRPRCSPDGRLHLLESARSKDGMELMHGLSYHVVRLDEGGTSEASLRRLDVKGRQPLRTRLRDIIFDFQAKGLVAGLPITDWTFLSDGSALLLTFTQAHEQIGIHHGTLQYAALWRLDTSRGRMAPIVNLGPDDVPRKERIEARSMVADEARGHAYLAVTYSNVIQMVDLDGRQLARFGKKGHGVLEFQWIRLACGPDGDLYVLDPELQRVHRISGEALAHADAVEDVLRKAKQALSRARNKRAAEAPGRPLPKRTRLKREQLELEARRLDEDPSRGVRESGLPFPWVPVLRYFMGAPLEDVRALWLECSRNFERLDAECDTRGVSLGVLPEYESHRGFRETIANIEAWASRREFQVTPDGVDHTNMAPRKGLEDIYTALTAGSIERAEELARAHRFDVPLLRSDDCQNAEGMAVIAYLLGDLEKCRHCVEFMMTKSLKAQNQIRDRARAIQGIVEQDVQTFLGGTHNVFTEHSRYAGQRYVYGTANRIGNLVSTRGQGLAALAAFAGMEFELDAPYFQPELVAYPGRR